MWWAPEPLWTLWENGANLDESGACDGTIQRQATAQTRSKYKDVTLQNCDPPRLNCAFSKKTKCQHVPVNCVTPLQFCIFHLNISEKITAEMAVSVRENIASKFLMWHDWSDIVEEDMFAFFVFVVSMGLTNLYDMKGSWSQVLLYAVPLFGDIFTRKCFLQIFWRWFLILTTVSEVTHKR